MGNRAVSGAQFQDEETLGRGACFPRTPGFTVSFPMSLLRGIGPFFHAAERLHFPPPSSDALPAGPEAHLPVVPPAPPGAGPSRTPRPALRKRGPCSSRQTLCHSCLGDVPTRTRAGPQRRALRSS